MPSEAFDYAVDFSEAVVWDKPIALEELGDKLSILKGRVLNYVVLNRLT
jgi:hypothetical protein